MEHLSKSEVLVLKLSAEDKSAGEIAAALNRSVFTIQAQIKKAKRKLNVNTIQGAVAKFVTSYRFILLIAMIATYILLKSTEITIIADTNILIK